VDEQTGYASVHSLQVEYLKRDDFFFESSSRFNFLPEHDLFRPAFARRSIKRNDELYQGFAQAGNRYPLFGIML
jgi:hypothetical protein